MAAGADRARRAAGAAQGHGDAHASRSRTSSSPTASRTAQPGEFVEAIEVPLLDRPERAQVLQDLQALRPGHLGGVRLLQHRRRRRHRARRRASASAAWRRRRSARQPWRPRSSAGLGPRPPMRPRCRAFERTSPRSPTCAARPTIACRSPRTCCASYFHETQRPCATRLVRPRSGIVGVRPHDARARSQTRQIAASTAACARRSRHDSGAQARLRRGGLYRRHPRAAGHAADLHRHERARARGRSSARRLEGAHGARRGGRC